MERKGGPAMRAVIVPFFQYPPQGTNNFYRVYFDYFLKQVEKWKDEFDRIYIIDHYWNITQDDVKHLADIVGDRYGIFTEENNYWENLSNVLNKVLEDKVLIMDMDTLVYQKGVLQKNFDLLDKYDLVSMFDGSGGNSEETWKKFPYLKERGYLRIAPYFCFAKTELMKGRDYMPYHKTNEDHADFGGVATLQILADNPKIAFLEDDRSSIYIGPDGKTYINPGPIENKEYVPQSNGVYHLRNWALGLRLIIDRLVNVNYLLPITPVTEGCRSLGWLWVISEKVGKLTENLKKEILITTKQYGLKDEDWLNYIEEFKKYHNWI